MISKHFIKNSITYTIAGTLPMASAIILLPFYTNYLSASYYGELAIYLGFSILIQTIVTYSFDASIYSFYHDFKNDKEKLARYVSSAFVFIIIIGIMTTLIMLMIGNWIFDKVFTEAKISFYPYGLISLATGVFQSVFKVNSNLLQTQEKASTFLILNTVSFALIATFTIVGLIIFPDNLIGPIAGRFIAVTIMGVIVLINLFRTFGLHFDLQLLKSTFGFNHPSLLYQIMLWFNTYFDRVVMTFYLPLAQIGIYDLAVKCLTVIEFILAGFYNTFFPKVLGMVALQKKKSTTIEINRYYNGLTATTIILIVLSIVFYPYLIKIFINKPGYLAAIPIIPFLGVSYLFRSMRMYMAMPYAAIRYQKPVPFFYALILGGKILMLVYFLPLYGILGAVYATWLSYILEITILYLGVRKKFEIKFNFKKLVLAPLSVGLMIVMLETLTIQNFVLLWHLLYVLASSILLLLLYKSEILMEWQMFKSKKLL